MVLTVPRLRVLFPLATGTNCTSPSQQYNTYIKRTYIHTYIHQTRQFVFLSLSKVAATTAVPISAFTFTYHNVVLWHQSYDSASIHDTHPARMFDLDVG